ncbi:signal transduction histidine kinase [Paenibacillus cellulosilyticus]|uniref:histidine kinase n=1 Tax=Paenibacillus cellulosilyticus TaxID=375489 RepID=A0A2V2YXD6_9BACL|nr:HAMP domain-containing sensor histidine kinase [Paenibacillus cellulosilyticus]PWW06488.1 signal transduction histidine kinase [Paenibacillus cellulosilyticus]QKS46171.1 HAMP domain-containing histidine kinase [Paenibacillus cellulosilyticus]
MSIRTRLQVALWAMVIVPNIIMISLIISLLYFLSDQTLHELMYDEKYYKDRQAIALGELSYVMRYEPERMENDHYLNDFQNRLTELQAGVVLERNGNAPIVTPMLRQAAPHEDWSKLVEEDRDQIAIDGYLYQIVRQDIVFADGGEGKVLLLRQQEQIPISWKIIVVTVGLFVLVGTSIFLTYTVSRSILKPLYSLKRSAEQISEGMLDGEVRPVNKDEIGELSTAFEAMRQRLKSSIAERLQEEENRKRLLSHISHDLKTPITAIKGYIEGILDGVANTREKQEKYLQTAYRKAADMDRLIDELFLFSKLDMQHVVYDFKPIDIRRFMKHYAEDQQFDLEKAGIVLELHGVAGEPLLVAADTEKLSRVFHNIIGNSVKYMMNETGDADRRIEISLRGLPGGYVQFQIRDNGPGVEPDALPMLFDQFYRTEQSRSTETGGSGLGLAIVKQIVQGHGGYVEASLPADGGLAITVTLRQWRNGHEHDAEGR